MIKSSLLAYFLLVFMISCSNSNSNSDSSSSNAISHLTDSAKLGVPQINSALAGTSIKIDSSFSGYSSSDLDLTSVVNLFKLACHTSDNSVNFCSDIGVTPSNDNILSTDLLIGMIEHARMYLNNVNWSNCSGSTAKTPVYSPSGSSVFFITIPNLIYYAGIPTSGSSTANNRTEACGKTSDTYIGAVTRREEYAPTPPATYSDVFQSYYRVTGSAEDPVILGFNLASYNDSPYAQRTVLITNMQKHKFVFKTCTALSAASCVSAYGTGGWDRSSNTWATGYYEVKRTQPSPKYYCLKNGATAEVDSTGNNCATLDPYFMVDTTTGDYWGNLVTFLELTDADKAALVNFSTLLKNTGDMSADQVPSSPSSFPQSVQ